MQTDYNLLDQIWEDANFKPKVKLTINKIDKNKKVIDNYISSNCKICNLPIKLPNTYNGTYPLCIIHRDPNDRLKFIFN
tara:strand:- start:6492 stop:6728 length:237 start_codon:yes stop_codon:yes gene_type:complete